MKEPCRRLLNYCVAGERFGERFIVRKGCDRANECQAYIKK